MTQAHRYDELIAKLDTAAKVRLLTAASFFSFTGNESIGLAPLAMSDGPTGVKGQSQSGGAPTSLLPSATLLAGSWSEQTLSEVGVFLAQEAIRSRTRIVLGPTINLHRSPLGGRVFEAFSEDPLLTGRLAAAYVRGLQSLGIAACLKHLVGNEAETDRHTVDDRIDEVTLREVYLLSFEIAIAGGVEVGTPPPARPGFIVDPVDGSPGLRLRITTADGELIVDEHLTDTRRVLGWQGEVHRPGTLARLTGRIDHEGALQIGVLGIGTWTITAGGASEQATVAPVTGVPGESLLAPPIRLLDMQVHGPTVLNAEIDPGELEHLMIGLIARPAPTSDDAAIAAAVAAARTADVAVVVVGLTAEQETESRDKTTLALPGAQDALVEAVAAVARRTVVVVNSSTPVLMPWADRVDAILVAGLTGQEGGHAVTAALLGTHEPSGRLVTSWPIADWATPAWSVTPVEGLLTYSEGAIVGYRGHAAGLAPAPQFWFGAGLGYGSWEYSGADVLDSSDPPAVRVSLRNKASRASREVVQVYFEPADADQPARLVDWSSIDVPADTAVEVTVHCDARMWRRWDTAAGCWDRIDATGELLVARGLGDIRLRVPVPATASMLVPDGAVAM